MSEAQQWLEIGRIGRPYGVRGWVHVESWMDPPEHLLEQQEWRVSTATAPATVLAVRGLRRHGSGFVAQLPGCDTPEQASRWSGATISIERARLPEPGEREIYRADLVGYAVRNMDGVDLGTVDHFVDAPAHPIMVVVGERERWLPLTPVHLQRVDREARVAWVDWPADF